MKTLAFEDQLRACLFSPTDHRGVYAQAAGLRVRIWDAPPETRELDKDRLIELLDSQDVAECMRGPHLIQDEGDVRCITRASFNSPFTLLSFCRLAGLMPSPTAGLARWPIAPVPGACYRNGEHIVAAWESGPVPLYVGGPHWWSSETTDRDAGRPQLLTPSGILATFCVQGTRENFGDGDAYGTATLTWGTRVTRVHFEDSEHFRQTSFFLPGPATWNADRPSWAEHAQECDAAALEELFRLGEAAQNKAAQNTARTTA